MVLGDDGIIGQATGASKAQAIGNARDAVNIALATMRTEDVADLAGVGTAPTGSIASRLETLLDNSGVDATAETGTDAKTVTIAVEDVKDFTSITVEVEKTTSGNYKAVLKDSTGATL